MSYSRQHGFSAIEYWMVAENFLDSSGGLTPNEEALQDPDKKLRSKTKLMGHNLTHHCAAQASAIRKQRRNFMEQESLQRL